MAQHSRRFSSPDDSISTNSTPPLDPTCLLREWALRHDIDIEDPNCLANFILESFGPGQTRLKDLLPPITTLTSPDILKAPPPSKRCNSDSTACPAKKRRLASPSAVDAEEKSDLFSEEYATVRVKEEDMDLDEPNWTVRCEDESMEDITKRNSSVDNLLDAPGSGDEAGDSHVTMEMYCCDDEKTSPDWRHTFVLPHLSAGSSLMPL